MTTLTIKIDSEVLAREVLTHLGYLPADGDLPDLVSVQPEPESVILDPLKTWIAPPNTVSEDMAERLTKLPFPASGRRETSYKYDGKFCTEKEEPKDGVEPVDNEIGTPVDIYSDEAKKESEELREQLKEVIKTIPTAEERLKAQVDELWSCDRLDHLDVMADHNDKAMREAVKAYVIKEYAGKDLKSWPNLKKILDLETL